MTWPESRGERQEKGSRNAADGGREVRGRAQGGASYALQYLADGRGVGGVQDLSHQKGLDRIPHNLCHRVGLQGLHQGVAEGS